VAREPQTVWRTSSRSGGGNQCVEVSLHTDVASVRDSKDRLGPVLTFAAGDWTAFMSALKAGEL
jgi:hypothetical protein